MQWITSGIENPSKSEVIDRCGGNEKTEWTDNRTLNKKIKKNVQKSIWFYVHVDICKTSELHTDLSIITNVKFNCYLINKTAAKTVNYVYFIMFKQLFYCILIKRELNKNNNIRWDLN